MILGASPSVTFTFYRLLLMFALGFESELLPYNYYQQMPIDGSQAVLMFYWQMGWSVCC